MPILHSDPTGPSSGSLLRVGLGSVGTGVWAEGRRPPSLDLEASRREYRTPTPLTLEGPPDRLTHLLEQPLLDSSEVEHHSGKPGALLPQDGRKCH